MERRMKSIFAFAAFLIVGSLQASFAEELASCTTPSGHSYYPYAGLTQEKDSGWTKDKISGGLTTLTKSNTGDYDILFVDVTKRITSSTQEGAIVRLMRTGDSEMTFIVAYPNDSIEIYTFLTTKAGQNMLTVLSSKGGSAIIPRSSVLISACAPITFK